MMNSPEQQKKKADERFSDFMAHVSCDTKVPLTSIKGYSDLLLSETHGPLNDFQRKSLQNINRSAQMVVDVIWQYLRLASIDSYSYLLYGWEAIDLPSVLKQQITWLQSKFDNKKQIIHINCPESTPTIQAKEPYLGKTLSILIEYAHLYSKPEETILITITSEKDMVRTTISTESYSEYILKGYGLSGFKIIEEFFEQFGGEIGVKSEEGKGSTVWFTLPIADESTET